MTPFRPIFSRIIIRAFSLVLLLLISCSCAGNMENSRAHTAGSAKLETRPLTIVTYNIHWGCNGLEEVAEAIAGLSPDIVLLQELERKTLNRRFDDQPAELARLLEPAGLAHFFYAPAAWRIGWEHGLAVASRFPILRAETLRLPNAPETKPRIALRAELAIGADDACERPGERAAAECLENGAILNVYNTHLVTATGLSWVIRHGSGGDYREKQAKTIRRWMISRGGSAVLGGDMNATSHFGTYEALSEGLVDAWLAAGDGWWGGTAYSGLPIVRVDYLFVTEDILVENSYVPDVQASDHRPLAARIFFPLHRP